VLQEAEESFQTVQKEVRELKQKPKPTPTEASPALALQPPRPLQVKDKVSVASVGLIGEILTLDMEDQTANVQVGGFRMQVPLYELRRAKHNPELERLESYRNPRTISLPAIPDVSMTFDMRGWRASEVQERLEAYLNDAFRANLPEIHLVHGKGTGVLRQIVRELLKKHPLIGSFTGGGSAGGEGVTIAKFVER
jgi:DNA mismatch repair protein MutS2